MDDLGQLERLFWSLWKTTFNALQWQQALHLQSNWFRSGLFIDSRQVPECDTYLVVQSSSTSLSAYEDLGIALILCHSTSCSIPAYYLVEGSGATYNRITTMEECEEAARQLGLTDVTVEDDENKAWRFDPPYCYFEYDGANNNWAGRGTLKFNRDGTNTGPCTCEDQCLYTTSSCK